ncbi:hypothetical protein NIES4071_54350 [Calothrix sp. NIES-4071]|nr:hypothetical protein NIES4071_54350 [Calothrix sp. NIES-4071]BAZ59743.1 hypothetical protein NIES4105_54300 [Calothrix sp. NIES-4105]
MIAQIMVQLSSWVETGIQISKVKNLHLFKFTSELQSRLEELSESKKAGILTEEQEAELTGILDLQRSLCEKHNYNFGNKKNGKIPTIGRLSHYKASGDKFKASLLHQLQPMSHLDKLLLYHIESQHL